jgi:hypothetical protein
MASHTDADLSDKLSRFLADENTTHDARCALAAFLDARPIYSKPTSYISDLEQRLELIRDIQQEYEKFKYESDVTAVLWSALMVIPLERLRYLREFFLSNFEIASEALSHSTNNVMPMLLKVCMLPYIIC